MAKPTPDAPPEMSAVAPDRKKVDMMGNGDECDSKLGKESWSGKSMY